jgi:arsenical pump membrane protein
LALVVVAVAILLLALRPPRVPAWLWPIAGAVLLILTGNEPLRDAAASIARQWNILLFILGLMAISAAADRSGAFEWIGEVVVRRAKGSRRRLFVLLFIACSIVTVFLSNDATAIALTPIVYRAVRRRLPGEVKPFLLGCVFAANTASFGLPFSNPANVLILPHPQLAAYLWHLGPAQIAAIAVTLAMFLFFFSRELQGTVETTPWRVPTRRTILTLWAFGAIVAAYFIALLVHWPLGPIAFGGSLLTIAVAATPPIEVAKRISWKTLALLAALFVLLDAVVRGGFVDWTLTELERALRYGSLATIAASAGGATLLSNCFNNLPVAVAAAYIVAHVNVPQVAYPLIVGVDVGPNLITTGSLATILWMTILRGYGIRIKLVDYLRLGALVVPAVLTVSVLWLWFAR